MPEWSIQLRRSLREAWSIHFELPMMQHLATVVLFIVVASHLPLATAFELSSLWGSLFGDGGEDDCSSSADGVCQNNAARFAYPRRRDLSAEFGEEGYQRRIKEAFGGDAPPSASPYGVDVSFPVHSHTAQPVPILGDKEAEYRAYTQGCRDYYGKKARACDESERDRINMNLRQPAAMQNYTDLGFRKVKAPKEIMSLLTEFWGRNKDRQIAERWGTGNTYVNHWETDTYMLSVENPSLEGGGSHLKQKIWDMAKHTMEEWSGQQLSPSSLYGIRVYKEGAVLAPHVDRLPLVISSIINVAQNVDEPWPLEVYGHDGKAYNVTMEVGDMLLYESHSVVHGRPFPLKGQFYANLFAHFEPVGHSLRHEARMAGGNDDEALFDAALRVPPEDRVMDDLPPYIMKGTLEEQRWRQQHKKSESTSTGEPTGAKEHVDGVITPAHTAAGDGNLDIIRMIAASDEKGQFHVKDQNGWQPIHEAARSGSVEIVEILIEHGVDINARPNDSLGGSPLWWSDTSHGESHPVSKLLRKHGAKKIAPSPIGK